MGTLHQLTAAPLAGSPPDAHRACLQGRRCHGTCTCVARVIQGHGRDCDGACEGGCIDADLADQGDDLTFGLDALDRLWARVIVVGFIAWCIAIAICAGALGAWAWPGLVALVRQ